MDQLEQQLGAVLNNPELMSKITSMAQSLSQNHADNNPSTESGPDITAVKNLSALAAQGRIDKQQQALLQALSPYLSNQKLHKLENAMRAAKMAKIASSMLGSGGFPSLTGR